MNNRSFVLTVFFALLLGLSGHTQSFSFYLLTDTLVLGQPAGDDIVVEGNIVNNTNTDIEVDIIRRENNLPAGWYSYLCTDICLSPFQDSTRLYLTALQTQNIKLSFMPGPQIDTANCLIVFRSVAGSPETMNKRMYGATNSAAGLSSQTEAQRLKVYPNPASDVLMISSTRRLNHIEVLDLTGQQVFETAGQGHSSAHVNISALPQGIYILKILYTHGDVTFRRFAVN
jgi:hypothetical protein